MASPLLFYFSLAPLLTTLRYPFTLLPSTDTILSTILYSPSLILYPLYAVGIGFLTYSLSIYSGSASWNPFASRPEGVGILCEESCFRCGRCLFSAALGIAVLGVATVLWVVMGFLRGKAKEGRVVRREEEEEEKEKGQGERKAPEEEEEKSGGDDVSKEHSSHKTIINDAPFPTRNAGY